MTELKPCDCGEIYKPCIRYKVVEDEIMVRYIPICRRCGGKVEAEAIEAWNRRGEE